MSQRSSLEEKNSAMRPGASSRSSAFERRRGVDDEQVVVALLVKLVEPLHGDVVVALGKPPGDVLVERVREDLARRRRVRRVPVHERVPGLAHVEHGGVELTFRAHARLGESLVGDAASLVAEPPDPEGVGQTARRVDGEHEHPAAEASGSGRRQRRRDGGLPDPTRAAGDGDLLGREQLLQVARLVMRRRGAVPHPGG